MPNTVFAFKQFNVKQDKCAMKVGTDAVLLGAWIKPNRIKNCLDIGTGTGVIALMLAQKTDASIMAIDVDGLAVEQATQNIQESKFKNQITVQHISLQQFALNTETKFDLIVSNPPFFEQSLKSINEQRSTARHTDLLSFEELINSVLVLLNPHGKFFVILPVLEADRFKDMAKKKGLFLSKLLRVKSRVDKEIDKRHIMQFEFTPTDFSEETLCIEGNERHEYTPEYKFLTKDYYVNF